MKAIRQYEFGDADTLRYEEVADPVPGPGQVRIRVAAAGLHLVDTSIRQGEQLGPNPPPTLPMTPGREVAGTVDLLGSDVDPSWQGRRVVATSARPAAATRSWRWRRPVRCTGCRTAWPRTRRWR